MSEDRDGLGGTNPEDARFGADSHVPPAGGAGSVTSVLRSARVVLRADWAAGHGSHRATTAPGPGNVTRKRLVGSKGRV